MNRPFPIHLRLIFSALLLALGFVASGHAYAQDQSTATPTPAAPAGSPAPDASATSPSPAAAPPAPAATNDNSSSVQTSSSATPPPTRHSPHLQIGPQLGVYLPTSSKARNRFGDAWFAVGIGLGTIAQPHNGQFNLDLDVITQQRSDHHAFIAPLGLQYTQALSRSGNTVPYVGVSGDLVFLDLRSPEDNVHSGLRESGGGSVFIGSTLGRNAYVEARYLEIASVKTFDVSGLNLNLGVRF